MKIRMNRAICILMLIQICLQTRDRAKMNLKHKERSQHRVRHRVADKVKESSKDKSKDKSKNMIADSDTFESDYDPDFQIFYDQEKKEQQDKQKALDSLQSVSYVSQISSYGKHQLNDQKLRKNSYMVGKPVYFESGITFDDTPQLYSDPSKALSDVDVPMSQNTIEKRNLWYNKEHQAEQNRNNPINMNQRYSDVYYKNNEGDIINSEKFNNLETIHSNVVNIQTVNKNNFKDAKQNDRLLINSTNPLKQQLFEKIKSEKFNIDLKNHNDDKSQLINQLGNKLEDNLDKDLDSIL